MNNSRLKKGNVFVHPSSIDHYAKQTWKFARTILWNNVLILPEEIELSVEYLKDYYRSIPPKLFVQVAADYFVEFCECILLAKRTTKETTSEKHCAYCGENFTPKRESKRYCSNICKQKAYLKRNGFSPSANQPLQRNPHAHPGQSHHFSHPCIWLNPLNPKGFSETRMQYQGKKITNPQNKHNMELIKNIKHDGNTTLRKDIKIKPYTLKELAGFYRVSKPTLLKWMKPFEQEIGPRLGYKYTAHQVEIILNTFLLPDELDALRKIA